MKLRRTALYTRVATATGMSMPDVRAACDCLLDTILSGLAQGHTVRIANFGVFRVVRPKKRMPYVVAKLDAKQLTSIIIELAQKPKLMIDDFPETEELSEHEKVRLLPLFIQGLSGHRSKSDAITAAKMMRGMKHRGYDITSARVRKIINHIRRHGLIPLLLASSEGYWVSDDKAEVEQYIKTLKQREEAIRVMRVSLQVQAQTFWNYKMEL